MKYNFLESELHQVRYTFFESEIEFEKKIINICNEGQNPESIPLPKPK